MASNCCVMAHRSFMSKDKPVGGAVIAGSVGQGGLNRLADTKLVQGLLNLVAPLSLGSKPPLKVDGMAGPLTIGAIKSVQKACQFPADGRVDPTGRTLARLNVLTVPKSGGGNFAVTGGPPGTPARMTPLEAAVEATPRAISWCVAATAQLAGLRSGLLLSGGIIFLPQVFTMVNTHFHLDRDASNILSNIVKIEKVFARILVMLKDPGTFYREGPETDKSKFADALMGGMDLPPAQRHITMRTQYPDCGPMCRSAMLLHEGAHFCGGLNEINHFSHEFPIPDGSPQDGSTRNYAQMTTSESMRNASSYAAFAIHAAFLVDHRFGLDKKLV